VLTKLHASILGHGRKPEPDRIVEAKWCGNGNHEYQP